VSTVSLYEERKRESDRRSTAEEIVRVSNGSTGLEIFAVTNLIIIVDLGPAIPSLRSPQGDSEQRARNSVYEPPGTHKHTVLWNTARRLQL
jgi:hypothetical protein